MNYSQAGIANIAEFYRDKFAYDADLDFTYKILNFYNLQFFKRVWLYSKIKSHSTILDFGCGSGMLAALKHKGCTLYGIDYSHKALEIAKHRNGYDYIFCGDIFSCDFPKKFFDYVVSLDVFGHIEFANKDTVIAQLKTFLKENGTMLHGIECGPVPYEQMSTEELMHFVQIDGHIGIESKQANLQRFNRFFTYVRGEVRFDLINTVEEYLHQQQNYHFELPPILALYLQSLNEPEREAFNIAAGLTHFSLEKYGISSGDEAAGFLLLEASDGPLHDNSNPLPNNIPIKKDDLIANGMIFFRGWYEPEYNQEEWYRWSAKEAFLYFPDCHYARLHFSLFSHYPAITENPVDVFIILLDSSSAGLSEKLLMRKTLYSNQPIELSFPVTQAHFFIKIYVATTWIPKYFTDHLLINNADQRELGIGIKWVYLSDSV